MRRQRCAGRADTAGATKAAGGPRPAGVRLRRATRGGQLAVRWLLAEWPPGEPEPVASWLAGPPAEVGLGLEQLVHLAKLRRRVEHDDRELKDALGLDHFEGAPSRAGTTT